MNSQTSRVCLAWLIGVFVLSCGNSPFGKRDSGKAPSTEEESTDGTNGNESPQRQGSQPSTIPPTSTTPPVTGPKPQSQNSDDTPEENEDRPDEDEDEDEDEPAPPIRSSNNAPRILSLTSSRYQLQPGQDLNLTAIVTDPDGIADLVGGRLIFVDRNGVETNRDYGVFATSAQEGAYSFLLTWESLAEFELIYSSYGDRVLRAVFYDQEGESVQQDLRISFTCPNDHHILCNGSCVDTNTDLSHCGECDRALADNTFTTRTSVAVRWGDSGRLLNKRCEAGRFHAEFYTSLYNPVPRAASTSCAEFCSEFTGRPVKLPGHYLRHNVLAGSESDVWAYFDESEDYFGFIRTEIRGRPSRYPTYGIDSSEATYSDMSSSSFYIIVCACTET